jgi:hypothetical protein
VRIGSDKIGIFRKAEIFGLQPEKQWIPTRTNTCATRKIVRLTSVTSSRGKMRAVDKTLDDSFPGDPPA